MHVNGTITPFELNIIATNLADSILLIGKDKLEVLALEQTLYNLNPNYKIKRITYHEVLNQDEQYDLVYTDCLWCVDNIPWIPTLSKLIYNDGLIVTTLFYNNIHIVKGKARHVEFKPQTSDFLTKWEWLNYLTEYWHLYYNSGIHLAWRLGADKWKLPNKQYSCYSLKLHQYPYKQGAKIIIGKKTSYVYNKSKHVIREYGKPLKISNWKSYSEWLYEAEVITSAFYDRALGPGTLELRSTDRHVCINGIISFPITPSRFKNTSDPFI